MSHYLRLVAGGLVAVCLMVACSSGGLPAASSPGHGSAVATEAPRQPVVTRPELPSPTPARPHCAPPYPQRPPTAETVRCADPTGMQRARVLRVVDGDTLHAEIGGVDETVRLYGVDTPERGEPCFEAATSRLGQLAGSEIRLLPDARDRDRFGRLLRYVYTPDGLSIDAELVAEGLGHAWRADGVLRDAILALEHQSAASATGCLWTGGR